MRNPIETYVSYDEDGSMKLSIPTTLFGGYDRAQTCEMIEIGRASCRERV